MAVPPLPLEQGEIDYLRLAEIDRYLEACADYYRPLAEFLIGTGARISEAITIRWSDLDLERGIVRVYRQRSRDSTSTRPAKGKRFRPVQIGPRLCETLRALADARAAARSYFGGSAARSAAWIVLRRIPSAAPAP